MDFIISTATIIFWFVVILLPLVAIHEFGHLLMARLVGVKVLEYGIGIPPRWLYKRWKGIIWSLNYVLIGGFARIYGDLDAIDEAHHQAQTDKEKARKEYIENRFSELVANQEIRFFIEDNNLEYNKDWEFFEKIAYKGVGENKVDYYYGLLSLVLGTTVEKENLSIEEKKTKILQKYEQLKKQISTLIDWEFDTRLTSKETFFNKSWWRQTLIILGGVTFNLISAVLFFWIMFGVTGASTKSLILSSQNFVNQHADIVYKSENIKIPQIIKDSPADKIGMVLGDELISFANVKSENINSIEDFRNIVDQNKNQEIQVSFKKTDTGEIKNTTVKLEEKDGKFLFGFLGSVNHEITYKAKNFGSGFQLAVSETYESFTLNFKILGNIFTALLPQTEDRSALEMVSGPIAVGTVSSKILKIYGISGILKLLALVSVSLAAFNLLPLPALDGGRLVIISLNKLFKKRNRKLEGLAISITFILLLLLSVVIAVKDINGIISGLY